MGAEIVAAVAGPVLGKVLGGSEKSSGKAQAAETARLDQQRKDEAAKADAERKKKSSQRTATGVIFGGAADNQSNGIGNLGG